MPPGFARRDLLSVFVQADAAIRQTIIVDVLRRRFNLPADSIDVDVDEGVVTLAGRTPWRSTAREVVDRVRTLDGVVDVIDHLSWTHGESANHTATPRPGSSADRRPGLQGGRRPAAARHRPSIIWTRD